MASTAAATGGEETERLYQQYGHQLYRYCHARLRSREEAEDAVQSVFVRVHGALLKGVKPRFEAAWLYKIAHNVCLSRRDVVGRRATHELTIDPTELDWALAAYDAKPDELFALPAALAEMPKNLRDALLLREWQGLSYAEIAEALGTTVSAVETLIFRARRHLAAALDPPERRPLVSRLGDAGWLYGAGRLVLTQLRGLLTVAAPAKLAAGAVVVAVGGVGIEEAVVASAADHTRDHSPAVVHASTLATPGPAVAVAVAAAVRTALAPAARPRTRAAAVFPAPVRLTAHVHSIAAVRGPSAAIPARPLPAPVTEPAHAEPAAAPAPAPDPAPSKPPTAPTPVAAVPPVELPSLPPVPTVEAPPVPAVPLPAVTVPAVTVPTVTTPAVTVPLPTVP